MTKVIFCFLLAGILGLSFLTAGCGGGEGAVTSSFQPTSTVAPEATGSVKGKFIDRDGKAMKVYLKFFMSNIGGSAATSTEVTTGDGGEFNIPNLKPGGWHLCAYKNQADSVPLATKNFDIVSEKETEITVIEGVFDFSPNITPTPTGVQPTVTPTSGTTPVGTATPVSTPTNIPNPNPGCAGVIINITDDSGVNYNGIVKLEYIDSAKYKADFNFPTDWHRIYNPLYTTITISDNKKLDLPGGQKFNVLIYSLTGQEVGSQVLETTIGTTVVLNFKIHSGPLYNVFCWFEFSNGFTTASLDPNGIEICDPNTIFQTYIKVSGDNGNYSKISLMSAHDYVAKWWQSPIKLYPASYSAELWIKRSGAKMYGYSPQSFNINSDKNLHIWETSPLLSGAFQTFLPGDPGIDHSYGNVTTSSGIKVLECPILPDGTNEAIPWAQNYNPGKQAFVSEMFDVLSEAVNSLSTAYFITVESVFGVNPSPKIWTNIYKQKKDFSQNTRKTILVYNYSDGINNLRVYSKLFKADGEINYYSLTIGPADSFYLSSSIEDYAPK